MRVSARCVLACVVGAALVRCSVEPTRNDPPAPTAPTPIADAPPPVAPSPPASRHDDDIDGFDYRDPFAHPTAPPAPPPPQERARKSRRYAVDELKLVGIVEAADGARAMLVDPRGKGWVVTQGEIIGRPEPVHADI